VIICPQCGEPSVETGALYRTERPGEVFTSGDGRRHVHPTTAKRRHACENRHSWLVDVAYPCPAPSCDYLLEAPFAEARA